MTFTAGLYFACPVEKIARWDKGYYVNIPQTPGRLDVPPEPRLAGSADDAWAAPVLRVVGQLPNEENQPCL